MGGTSDIIPEAGTEQQACDRTGKQEQVGISYGSTRETEHPSIRCGLSFQDLLSKLARMHETVLQELGTLRTENDALRHSVQVATPTKLREAGLCRESRLEVLTISPYSEHARADPSERISVKQSDVEVPAQCSAPKPTSLVECDGSMEVAYPSSGKPSTSLMAAVAHKEDRWAERPSTTVFQSLNSSNPERTVIQSPNSSNLAKPPATEEPASLPANFEARSEWLIQQNSSTRQLQRASRLIPTRKTSVQEDADKVELIMTYTGCLRHFISFPASRYRTLWDLVGAVLIFWDLALIPLNNSFLADKESSFVDSMDWITLVFWTMNMPASLLVGYVKDGVTVMIPRRILINYLRTWFVLDLVVVVPDWIFSIAKMVGSNSNAGSSVKLLRIIRLARCMRLLRLAKLRLILESLNDLINSEYVSIIVNIFKMILTLLACNHFIGCAWFMMSELSNGSNWVAVHGFSEEVWTYQYATSFHWSITQFTPSSMHVQPQNLLERSFAITVVVFGLVGFSYLVGSITGSLTELRKMNSDMTKQFWHLRRYLKQNLVPTELAVRIQKYLEHQWQMRKISVLRENVAVLKFLSEQLTHEMQCAIVVPHMLIHPLFAQLNIDSCVTMQRLANNVISRKLLAAGDYLFHPLEIATHMSFVVDGKLQYTRMGHGAVKEWVDKGEDWIAEPVLWTPAWYHHGQLVAAKSCDLLLINAGLFPGIIQRNPHAHFIVSGYATRYLDRLNDRDADNLSDITQGELETEEIQELLDNFGSRGRRLRNSFSRSRSTFKTKTRRFIHKLASPFSLQR